MRITATYPNQSQTTVREEKLNLKVLHRIAETKLFLCACPGMQTIVWKTFYLVKLVSRGYVGLDPLSLTVGLPE